MSKVIRQARKVAVDHSSGVIISVLLCLLAVAVPRTTMALAAATPAAEGSWWGRAPMPGDEFWQRGFQEGMLGALRDLENHREPNPANRDDFRHPHVPYGMQDLYRQGFRRGYNQAVSKLTGTDFRSWITGPRGEARQQGFRDGVAGAIKDFGNHRRPDPDNRDEFRRPPVGYADQQPYREGFRRGYRWAMSQLMGDNRG